MITNVYAIFDNKALMYNVPWCQPTHGAAARMLENLVNDHQTAVGQHPADYVLFQIGTYDDAKALLTPISPLVHVMDAISLVKMYGQSDMFERQQRVERMANGGSK